MSGSGERITIQSSDGDLEVERIAGGDAELRTSDGDVDVVMAGGSLDAQSGDGDLRVELDRESEVRVRTGDGDIALYIPAYLEFPAELVRHTTVPGDPAYLVRVTLPMGGIAVYALDAGSFLPVRVDPPDWGWRPIPARSRSMGWTPGRTPSAPAPGSAGWPTPRCSMPI